MLAPKRVKFRKQQKGRRGGTAFRGSSLAFGDYGLKAGVRGWIRVFPDKPLTKKPAETRMGKGKGSPELWVVVIKPGRMIFEMEGVDRTVAKQAFRLAAHKLPLETEFIERGQHAA